MILHSKYTTVDLKLRTADNRQILFNHIKSYIRQAFDNCHTSLEAESLIVLAKEKGYQDLAEEMSIDLETELSA